LTEITDAEEDSSMSTANMAQPVNDGAAKEQAQLVTFKLGREMYCVEILKVREIIRLPAITRVPNTPPYVEGVFNLRGKVIPVVCLRKRLGMADAAYGNRARIIVIDSAHELLGFIVDSVEEVVRAAREEIQPPPARVSSILNNEYLSGVIQQGDKLLILLNLDLIFSQDDQSMLESLQA
jgi:purine-binding chemotaxis protein CheW